MMYARGFPQASEWNISMNKIKHFSRSEHCWKLLGWCKPPTCNVRWKQKTSPDFSNPGFGGRMWLRGRDSVVWLLSQPITIISQLRWPITNVELMCIRVFVWKKLWRDAKKLLKDRIWTQVWREFTWGLPLAANVKRGGKEFFLHF